MSPPTFSGAGVRGLVDLNVVRCKAGVVAVTGVVGETYGGSWTAGDSFVVEPASSSSRRSVLSAAWFSASGVLGRYRSVGIGAGRSPAARTTSPKRLVLKTSETV